MTIVFKRADSVIVQIYKWQKTMNNNRNPEEKEIFEIFVIFQFSVLRIKVC